jgi:hypothetical protein
MTWRVAALAGLVLIGIGPTLSDAAERKSGDTEKVQNQGEPKAKPDKSMSLAQFFEWPTIIFDDLCKLKLDLGCPKK